VQAPSLPSSPPLHRYGRGKRVVVSGSHKKITNWYIRQQVAGKMPRQNQPNRSKALLAIVRELLLAEAAYQEIYRKYKEGNLRFPDTSQKR
jgi:hypothetical protein